MTWRLSLHKAPLSRKINLRSIPRRLCESVQRLAHTNKYLAARGDARVKDWASWVANATFKTDEEKRAAPMNAVDKPRSAPRPGSMQLSGNAVGVAHDHSQGHVRKQNRRVRESGADHPPYLLGGALEPEVNDRGTQSCCQGFTALLGGPEADVPAGYVTTTYDPKYVLSADKKKYIAVTGECRIEAAASHADQHDVLGRARQRLRRHQSGVGVRGRDAPPGSTAFVWAAARSHASAYGQMIPVFNSEHTVKTGEGTVNVRVGKATDRGLSCSKHDGCTTDDVRAEEQRRVPDRRSLDHRHSECDSRRTDNAANRSCRRISTGRKRTTASARRSSPRTARRFLRRRAWFGRARRFSIRPRRLPPRPYFRISISTKACRSSLAE